jgi:hypothetical protein
MDERFARAILSGPLVFGDPTQIAARDLLGKIEHWRARLARCKRCGTTGFVGAGRGGKYRLCDCIKSGPYDVLRALGCDIERGPAEKES